MTPTKATTYCSNEVSELAGVSLRQLQWWDERGVVRIHKEGHRRVYYTVDVEEICILAAMRRKGLSLQAIRKYIRKINSLTHKENFVVIHDRKISIFETVTELISISAAAKGPVYILDIARIREGVAAHDPHARRARMRRVA